MNSLMMGPEDIESLLQLVRIFIISISLSSPSRREPSLSKSQCVTDSVTSDLPSCMVLPPTLASTAGAEAPKIQANPSTTTHNAAVASGLMHTTATATATAFQVNDGEVELVTKRIKVQHTLCDTNHPCLHPPLPVTQTTLAYTHPCLHPPLPTPTLPCDRHAPPHTHTYRGPNTHIHFSFWGQLVTRMSHKSNANGLYTGAAHPHTGDKRGARCKREHVLHVYVCPPSLSSAPSLVPPCPTTIGQRGLHNCELPR